VLLAAALAPHLLKNWSLRGRPDCETVSPLSG
jgi:hypothetical protein